MPPRADFSFSRARRHQVQPQPTPPQQFVDPQEDSDLTQDEDEDDELVEGADGEEEEEEEEEEPLGKQHASPLKCDISSTSLFSARAIFLSYVDLYSYRSYHILFSTRKTYPSPLSTL
ncbi:hypothetical protein BU16DRAFT_529760 [Lophium mytilinum]|uniref:Uncharacterized protein n=1 Tax=Lophium mytilinum TaxID=390894 RepID=A0A6A6QK00_9PEZI|nr:hypothetical protein BU16DRAFT_529760 [Lophium mytilinum]